MNRDVNRMGLGLRSALMCSFALQVLVLAAEWHRHIDASATLLLPLLGILCEPPHLYVPSRLCELPRRSGWCVVGSHAQSACMTSRYGKVWDFCRWHAVGAEHGVSIGGSWGPSLVCEVVGVC